MRPATPRFRFADGEPVRRGDGDAFVARGHVSGDLADVHPFGEPGVDRELEPLDEPREVASAVTSRASSSSSCSGEATTSASVCATPRITVTGVRSSCERRATSWWRRAERSTSAACAASSSWVRRRSRSSASVSSSITRGVTWADRSAPLGAPADGGQDLVAVGVLQDVARGPGDEHPADDLLVLVARERDDPEVGEVRLEQAGGLDAVHRRHPDVHQDHVGRERTHELEGLGARARLADHLRGCRPRGATGAIRGSRRCRPRRGPGSADCARPGGEGPPVPCAEVSGGVGSGAIRRAWVS